MKTQSPVTEALAASDLWLDAVAGFEYRIADYEKHSEQIQREVMAESADGKIDNFDFEQ